MDFVNVYSFRFLSKNLPVWFAQAESSFARNRITSDYEKYDYIISSIPSEYAIMFEDIILNPPADNRYEYVKHEVIKRMSVHQLQKEKPGTKPSEYLRRLIKVAQQHVPHERILNIWLNNLPIKVREIVSLETSNNINTLCEMADKVMALATLSATPSPHSLEELPNKQLGMIMHRIDKLSKQVLSVQLMLDEDYEEDEEQEPMGQENLALPELRQNEAINVFNMKPDESPNGYCCYHTIFGDKAIACITPCNYKFSPTEYFLRK